MAVFIYFLPREHFTEGTKDSLNLRHLRPTNGMANCSVTHGVISTAQSRERDGLRAGF